MPLHDWTTISGWDGVHQVWIVELLYWIKPRLPAGYRAYIRTTPTFAVGDLVEERPDIVVRHWPEGNGPPSPAAPSPASPPDPSEEPDQEIAVTTLGGEKALFVEQEGRLIAALELVSPRNKDRPSSCVAYGLADKTLEDTTVVGQTFLSAFDLRQTGMSAPRVLSVSSMPVHTRPISSRVSTCCSWTFTADRCGSPLPIESPRSCASTSPPAPHRSPLLTALGNGRRAAGGFWVSGVVH